MNDELDKLTKQDIEATIRTLNALAAYSERKFKGENWLWKLFFSPGWGPVTATDMRVLSSKLSTAIEA